MQGIETLESQIGPRGDTQVNSGNRTLVRRWLTANGVSSKTARGLSLAALREAYNDTTGEALAQLTGMDPEPATKPEPQPQPQQQQEQPAMPNQQQQQPGQDQVQQIATMLSQFMGGGQGVDRDAVREIVKEMGPELVAEHGTRKVELIRPDGAEKIEGAHYALDEVTRTLNAGVHVWLPGPAGSGKTTLAKQAAHGLGLDFYATGAVHSVYALIGYTDATGTLKRTPFRDAFEHGGVFLFDEVDGSNPACLTAINQAIDNNEYAFPDGMVERHPEFRCIAAANTYGHGATSEYVGRIKQDGAVIDRFVFIGIDYDENVEKQLAGDWKDWHREVSAVRRKVAELGIQHIVSPRATRDGARMLSAGVDRDTVRTATLRKGLDSASWDRVKEVLA